MKVLINRHLPLSMEKEGIRARIEAANVALEAAGVETDFLQWWNARQNGDVLHQFGALRPSVAKLAQLKGWKVVVTILPGEPLDGTQSGGHLRRLVVRILARMPLPESVRDRFPWRIFEVVDRLVVNSSQEKSDLEENFGVQPDKISVVPFDSGLGTNLRLIYESVCQASH